jgi:hypothetical protein
MRTARRQRHRAATAATVATVSLALISAAAIACGAAYGESEEDIPPIDRFEDASPGIDGTSTGLDGGGDAGGDADAKALADAEIFDGDAAPIPPDASLDGSNPPGCPGAASCARVVFVTSETRSFEYVAGADTTCMNFANSSVALPRIKGRQFAGWATTANGSPSVRFVHGTGPYIRPDGTVIASNWTDLTDGTLTVPIIHDERGLSVTAGERVWTGTATDGTASSPNCLDWASADDTARVGVVGATNVQWTRFLVTEPCMSLFRLYCFEK